MQFSFGLINSLQRSNRLDAFVPKRVHGPRFSNGNIFSRARWIIGHSSRRRGFSVLAGVFHDINEDAGQGAGTIVIYADCRSTPISRPVTAHP